MEFFGNIFFFASVQTDAAEHVEHCRYQGDAACSVLIGFWSDQGKCESQRERRRYRRSRFLIESYLHTLSFFSAKLFTLCLERDICLGSFKMNLF